MDNACIIVAICLAGSAIGAFFGPGKVLWAGLAAVCVCLGGVGVASLVGSDGLGMLSGMAMMLLPGLFGLLGISAWVGKLLRKLVTAR